MHEESAIGNLCKNKTKNHILNSPDWFGEYRRPSSYVSCCIDADNLCIFSMDIWMKWTILYHAIKTIDIASANFCFTQNKLHTHNYKS